MIVGPTASGKTDLAIKLSQQLGIPIINFDTVQFRKYIEVLSCSPTKEEKVRATHYLYNYLEPEEAVSLGYWCCEADKFPYHIAVGGSIFYALNILRGVPDIKVPQEVKDFINSLDDKYLYLKQLEPHTKIHKNDLYRTNRRLEILLSPPSNSVFREYDIIKLNPENLMEKIEKRTNIILDDSVTEALKYGYIPQYKNIIGYKELWDLINDKITRNEAVERITILTKRYARRQINFMKYI